MRDHKAIIGSLGGIRPLARKLKHPVHTTVQGWSDRNSIPLEHWASVLAVASEEGVKLSPNDLMPTELRRAS